MQQIEKLSVFLGSPGDVQQERDRVRTVIEEINRTVAPDKGVFLELINSDHAIPGYGKDGQAIINEQIGDMQKYDLFVGIMWNRIGTPTARDISGTAEEYARAVNSWRRRKKPEIWFYFRNASANLKTQAELDQRAGVLRFREKLRTTSLFREYTTRQSFEKMFREHLIQWLNTRSQKRLPAPGGKTRPGRAAAPVSDSPAPPRTSRSTTTTTKVGPKPPAGRNPAAKQPASGRSPIAKSPGTWCMLDDRFFQTMSTKVQDDRSIVLRIPAKTMEQTADLRALKAGNYQHGRGVSYADQHEAGTTRVQTVESETSQGQTIFTITLGSLPQLNNSGIHSDFSFNGYSADDIAELRARLILLGQPLPKGLEYVASTYYTSSISQMSRDPSIQALPQLWASLHTQPRLFLPQAWLYAAYLLKTGNVVESIIALELGPIKDRKMSVLFRGRRARMYANREPVTISIEGACVLEP